MNSVTSSSSRPACFPEEIREVILTEPDRKERLTKVAKVLENHEVLTAYLHWSNRRSWLIVTNKTLKHIDSIARKIIEPTHLAFVQPSGVHLLFRAQGQLELIYIGLRTTSGCLEDKDFCSALFDADLYPQLLPQIEKLALEDIKKILVKETSVTKYGLYMTSEKSTLLHYLPNLVATIPLLAKFVTTKEGYDVVSQLLTYCNEKKDVPLKNLFWMNVDDPLALPLKLGKTFLFDALIYPTGHQNGECNALRSGMILGHINKALLQELFAVDFELIPYNLGKTTMADASEDLSKKLKRWVERKTEKKEYLKALHFIQLVGYKQLLYSKMIDLSEEETNDLLGLSTENQIEYLFDVPNPILDTETTYPTVYSRAKSWLFNQEPNILKSALYGSIPYPGSPNTEIFFSVPLLERILFSKDGVGFIVSYIGAIRIFQHHKGVEKCLPVFDAIRESGFRRRGGPIMKQIRDKELGARPSPSRQCEDFTQIVKLFELFKENGMEPAHQPPDTPFFFIRYLEAMPFIKKLTSKEIATLLTLRNHHGQTPMLALEVFLSALPWIFDAVDLQDLIEIFTTNDGSGNSPLHDPMKLHDAWPRLIKKYGAEGAVILLEKQDDQTGNTPLHAKEAFDRILPLLKTQTADQNKLFFGIQNREGITVGKNAVKKKFITVETYSELIGKI